MWEVEAQDKSWAKLEGMCRRSGLSAGSGAEAPGEASGEEAIELNGGEEVFCQGNNEEWGFLVGGFAGQQRARRWRCRVDLGMEGGGGRGGRIGQLWRHDAPGQDETLNRCLKSYTWMIHGVSCVIFPFSFLPFQWGLPWGPYERLQPLPSIPSPSILSIVLITE